ncbi:hypothetical protein BESB_055210 [Besnoitia besnoiti]|uniref:Uncharacterized protein n=1 Tax=Besnoitia besnoiti TaxID=94643 RepID=A0A2A9MKB5_BESBE|nr:hypothetical protein BESB_055210 [Besnoitia besnoiti]PFH35870.1 hypothetical protein BESB_055210 [Besnoitia besnoiti]
MARRSQRVIRSAIVFAGLSSVFPGSLTDSSAINDPLTPRPVSWEPDPPTGHKAPAPPIATDAPAEEDVSDRYHFPYGVPVRPAGTPRTVETGVGLTADLMPRGIVTRSRDAPKTQHENPTIKIKTTAFDASTPRLKEQADQAGSSSCPAHRARVIEARLRALKSQTEAAVKEVHRAQLEQQQLIARLDTRINAVNELLDGLEENQECLVQRLQSTGDVFVRRREEQSEIFIADMAAFAVTSGLTNAFHTQGEIATKLERLTTSTEKNAKALTSLLRRMDTQKDEMKAWLTVTLRRLEMSIDERTNAMIHTLRQEAERSTQAMQQQLNDKGLDNLLLMQALDRVEAQLSARGIAIADISHLDEEASFYMSRAAFEKALKGRLQGEKVMATFVVTQCPSAMNGAAFMNTYLLPSSRSFRTLFKAAEQRAGVSAVVVRIQSVMAEALMEIDGKPTSLQYVTPSAHEALNVTSKDRFGYEISERLEDLGAGDFGPGLQGRLFVVVYLGTRNVVFVKILGKLELARPASPLAKEDGLACADDPPAFMDMVPLT